jgi:hypothetical protein
LFLDGKGEKLHPLFAIVYKGLVFKQPWGASSPRNPPQGVAHAPNWASGAAFRISQKSDLHQIQACAAQYAVRGEGYY